MRDILVANRPHVRVALLEVAFRFVNDVLCRIQDLGVPLRCMLQVKVHGENWNAADDEVRRMIAEADGEVGATYLCVAACHAPWYSFVGAT